MIKTRFWFELTSPEGGSALLYKVIQMPFQVTEEQLFELDLDNDEQLELVVKHEPSFNLTKMELTVYLGPWMADNKNDWEETQAACLRAEWAILSPFSPDSF